MTNLILKMLERQPLIILDGAVATELERRGVDLCDPLWSAKCLIEQPDLIRAVHLDYYNAGADVATTSSYQATFESFAKRGINTRGATQLMRDSVSLATQARDQFWDEEKARAENPCQRQKPLVAASVGPYGAMLADGSEYSGRYKISDQELMDFHGQRLRVLIESGADLIACETIPCLREALVIAHLLEFYPNACAWIAFSCRDNQNNCEGQPITECAAALNPFTQIASIGVNCTRPEFVASLLQRIHLSTHKPLLAYPNSGEVYDATDKQWHGAGHAASLTALAPQWYSEGARLIGGCCRTTPADIRELKTWAKRNCPSLTMHRG